MVLIGIDPYPYHKISKIGGLGAMSSDESRLKLLIVALFSSFYSLR
jgi:hypothetical protein